MLGEGWCSGRETRRSTLLAQPFGYAISLAIPRGSRVGFLEFFGETIAVRSHPVVLAEDAVDRLAMLSLPAPSAELAGRFGRFEAEAVVLQAGGS